MWSVRVLHSLSDAHVYSMRKFRLLDHVIIWTCIIPILIMCHEVCEFFLWTQWFLLIHTLILMNNCFYNLYYDCYFYSKCFLSILIQFLTSAVCKQIHRGLFENKRGRSLPQFFISFHSILLLLSQQLLPKLLLQHSTSELARLEYPCPNLLDSP